MSGSWVALGTLIAVTRAPVWPVDNSGCRRLPDGEDQIADIVLGGGFICKTGQDRPMWCRLLDAGGLKLEYANTNWIHYDFDWSN